MFELDSRNEIVRRELYSISCALHFRVGFYEDVTAGATTHASPGAEKGGDGEQLLDEAGRVDLLVALSDAGVSGPTCVAEFGDGCSFGSWGDKLQTFDCVGTFTHGGSFGGGFFAVGAYIGVEVHNSCEGAWGIVIYFAGGAEKRVRGGGFGQLGVVEGLEGGEAGFGLSIL